ncbi:MAG: hypothetical protein VX527_04020 [Planctomycetota bacterium]|nr:hypothetical protein [Planctomycetota bacterium]
MNKMIAMTAAAGLLLAAGTASAGITLASTGATNYPTIQAAVNQAANNPHNADTITLTTAGDYAGFSVGGIAFANLTIIGPTWTHGPGVYPPASIAGVNTGPGGLANGPNITLSQIGVTGSTVGIYVTDNSTVTLENCDVYNNIGTTGVEMDSGVLTLYGSYIAGNEGPSYPGVINTGGKIYLKDKSYICGNTHDGRTFIPVSQQIENPHLVNPDATSATQDACHFNGLTDMNYDMVHSLEDVRLLRKNHHGLCHHDLNGNGATDIDDLLLTIEGWGDSCTP